jgi:hypothetical protein
LIINCRAATPAAETLVAREVTAVLERRARMSNPPVSLTVSDAVALGIAAQFRSPTASGQVLDYFCRTGRIDSDELIQAAQFEQGYASAEGHAALYCLIGWARGRAHRGAEHSGARWRGRSVAASGSFRAVPRSTLSQLRRALYLAQRDIGDVQAAEKGPDALVKRVARRRARRSIFRLMK